MEGEMAGILCMEYASEEDARRGARRYGDCPHVYFWANDGASAYIILSLSEEKRAWAQHIGEHPKETFGGTRAWLAITDQVVAPEELGVRLPDKKSEVSPCGSRCATCPALGEMCPGCPAVSLP